MPKAKGYHRLRKHRISAAGCQYFLTLCTAGKARGLACNQIFDTSLAVFSKIESESKGALNAQVIMPDHLHLLITLQGSTTLSQFVASYKGRLSPTLRKKNLSWQKGAYFDRRLRKNDSIDVVLRYMQMNPYRNKLIEHPHQWPYWYCDKQHQTYLSSEGETNVPLPEWLAKG
ncbi:MAG: transposase [Verrucomicrobiota bacterium]